MSTAAEWILGAAVRAMAIAASALACTRSPAPPALPDLQHPAPEPATTPGGARVIGDHLAIWGLAIRDRHVYVNVGGERIARIPTRGGALVEIARSGDDRRSIGAMVLDERALYFAQFESGLFRVPRAGGRRTTILADPRRIGALALVGDHLVWAIDHKELHGPPQDRIEMMKASGGSIITLATGLQLSGAWDADESRVYFATRDSVMSIGTSGAGPTLIADGQQNTTVIAHDDARLFWAASPFGDHGISADANVMSAPLGGGAATTIAVVPGGIVAMAADAENLYLGTVVIGSAEGQSAVVRLAKQGGTPIELVETRSIAGVVLDDRHVYYGSDPGGNEGTLHAIAKE